MRFVAVVVLALLVATSVAWLSLRRVEPARFRFCSTS